MTPDGTKLLVAHTADARLVVFDLTAGETPTIVAEIQVGLEPVTVRARSNTEAWVVNHISDSISIVTGAALIFSVVVASIAGFISRRRRTKASATAAGA